MQREGLHGIEVRDAHGAHFGKAPSWAFAQEVRGDAVEEVEGGRATLLHRHLKPIGSKKHAMICKRPLIQMNSLSDLSKRTPPLLVTGYPGVLYKAKPKEKQPP